MTTPLALTEWHASVARHFHTYMIDLLFIGHALDSCVKATAINLLVSRFCVTPIINFG